MFYRIIIFIVIIIILIFISNCFGIIKIENFSNFNKINNSNVPHLNNRFKSSKLENRIKKNENQEIDEINEKILFNNRDYNENLSIDNKNNKYYYNDMINQSDINETAFNVIYSIDPIDYSNVKTGIEKCNEECKGICYENGYDGIATCYPSQPQGFDWGTLYKNPTFTYGYDAYGPENLPQ